MLLHHFFENTVTRCPETTALICAGQKYSYRELGELADRFAITLQNCGIMRGDRVAVFLDNSLEAVVSIFAVLKIGAVFMPINSQTKMEKLAYLLNDARPSGLVSHRNLERTVAPALAAAKSVTTCVMVGEPVPANIKCKNTIAFSEAVATAGGGVVDTGVIDQDLAAVIYTSGSTGEPKGVMLTHRNMITACDSVSSYLGLRHGDVILCALPLSFDYGLYQILMGFKVGATVVLERSFTFPVKILETMTHERVTVFPGVPTMFAMLLNMSNLAQYDLSQLRLITNTAAALPEEHIRQIRKAFPGATLFSMYGLTECKRVSYLPPEQLDVRPSSVGRGMPNQEWWLADEAGTRLPHGSTGELVVRGSHVMRGYWENPEATAERLKPGPFPAEMVLYTGDIFRTDAQGFLYFVGRKDDIIKSRGEKISPREVENVLYSIEGVREAAVIGVPDPILGQALKAVLALADGYRYSEKEVINYCLSKLENYMTPSYVEFVEELPKTNTGKIRKTELR